MENLFKEFMNLILVFVDALGAVFLIFYALKTSLKTKRFFVKNEISSSGSGGADRGGIWSL